MADYKTATEPLADVSQFLSGEYLKAKDVEDGPLTFGILRVDIETFDAKGDRKKSEKKLVLALDGDPLRKLPLNQTNLQVFVDAWGKDARRWIGKLFDAYYDPNVRDPGGKRTGGLRVRVREAVAARVAPGTNDSAERPRDAPPF